MAETNFENKQSDETFDRQNDQNNLEKRNTKMEDDHSDELKKSENIKVPHMLTTICENCINDDNFVYKSCYANKSKWFIILKKQDDTITNENRKPVFDSRFAKFRANQLLVILIINVDDFNNRPSQITNQFGTKKSDYIVGNIVKAPDFDENINKVCAAGIHYFKTPLPAYYYASFYRTSVYSEGDSGYSWRDCGRLETEIVWNDDTNFHEHKRYDTHGNTIVEGGIMKDKFHGKWTYWYDAATIKLIHVLASPSPSNSMRNGPIKEREIHYVNGTKHGMETTFYSNGAICMQGMFDNGKYVG